MRWRKHEKRRGIIYDGRLEFVRTYCGDVIEKEENVNYFVAPDDSFVSTAIIKHVRYARRYLDFGGGDVGVIRFGNLGARDSVRKIT